MGELQNGLTPVPFRYVDISQEHVRCLTEWLRADHGERSAFRPMRITLRKATPRNGLKHAETEEMKRHPMVAKPFVIPIRQQIVGEELNARDPPGWALRQQSVSSVACLVQVDGKDARTRESMCLPINEPWGVAIQPPQRGPEPGQCRTFRHFRPQAAGEMTPRNGVTLHSEKC
jgi:hypothetical protein